jgi:hypothetical protein
MRRFIIRDAVSTIFLTGILLGAAEEIVESRGQRLDLDAQVGASRQFIGQLVRMEVNP